MFVKCGNKAAHGNTETHHNGVSEVRECYRETYAAREIVTAPTEYRMVENRNHLKAEYYRLKALRDAAK